MIEANAMAAVTGKTLIDMGFKSGPWFPAAIADAERMRASGGSAEQIRIAIAAHAPAATVPAPLRPTGAIPYHLNIAPEMEGDAANIAAVEAHMAELMRVPTVRAGAVMPDACPSDSVPGTIPVGGVVASTAIHPGMQAIIEAAEHGLDLMLAAVCDKPSKPEIEALRNGLLRLAVLGAPPLAWIVLDAGVISYDAPYARGLASAAHGSAIGAACQRIETWTADQRGLMMLAVLDRGTIAALRTMSLSGAWWRTLGQAIAATPEAIDERSYHAAINRDASRWTTKQMLAQAGIIEVAGRV